MKNLSFILLLFIIPLTVIGSGRIIDADIASNAAISRSKIASGDANEIVANDGSGDLTSLSAAEAQAIIGSVPQVLTQQSTPANPSAGLNKLYFKTDGKLYTLDSSGAETEVGSGGGTWGSITGTLSDQNDLQNALDAKAPSTTGTSILKGNGSGGFASATSGTDYAPATSGTSILKGDGSGGFSSASAGTDYEAPLPSKAGNSGKVLGTNGTTNSYVGPDGIAFTPDDSDDWLVPPTQLQEALDNLAAQKPVINNGNTRVASLSAPSGGSCAIVSSSSNFLSGTPTSSGAGLCTLNFASGAFASAPICTATANVSGGYLSTVSVAATTSSVTIRTVDSSSQTASSQPINVVCQAPQPSQTVDIFEAGDFDWTTYPYSIKGTTSDPTVPSGGTQIIEWKRVGGTASFRWRLIYASSSGGSAGSGTYYLPLLPGLSFATNQAINTSVGTSSGNTLPSKGNQVLDSGGIKTLPMFAYAYASDKMAFYRDVGTLEILKSSEDSYTRSSGTSINIEWSVKIKEWSTYPLGAATLPSVAQFRYTGANGSGSTDTKIRRFATVVKSEPNDIISVTDNSTNGTYFTALKRCKVDVVYFERANGTSNTLFGLSLNSTQLTTNINTITAAYRVGMAEAVGNTSTDSAETATASIIMEVGDVLRPHIGSNANASSMNVDAFFNLTAIAVQ